MSSERLLMAMPIYALSCSNPKCDMDFVVFGLIGAVLNEQEWVNYCPYCGKMMDKPKTENDRK